MIILKALLLYLVAIFVTAVTAVILDGSFSEQIPFTALFIASLALVEAWENE